jgi:hypothetical protein
MINRLIDAGALEKVLRDEYDFHQKLYGETEDLDDKAILAAMLAKLLWSRSKIRAQPTVDAVEVVRCKDCDNWYEEMKAGRPELGNVTAPCSEWSDQENGMARYTCENDFCSYGVRRQDD